MNKQRQLFLCTQYVEAINKQRHLYLCTQYVESTNKQLQLYMFSTYEYVIYIANSTRVHNT